MLYTPMTKAALKTCFEAHEDQSDKSGLPYVFHPFHVAEQMTTEAETCAALLHDVVEDTGLTADYLRRAGMSDAAMDALALLTHDPAIPYVEYVERLARNPIARHVKMAGLRHNMDLTRLDRVTDEDRRRVAKYQEAYELLERAEQAAEAQEQSAGVGPDWDTWGAGSG